MAATYEAQAKDPRLTYAERRGRRRRRPSFSAFVGVTPGASEPMRTFPRSIRLASAFAVLALGASTSATFSTGCSSADEEASASSETGAGGRGTGGDTASGGGGSGGSAWEAGGTSGTGGVENPGEEPGAGDEEDPDAEAGAGGAADPGEEAGAGGAVDPGGEAGAAGAADPGEEAGAGGQAGAAGQATGGAGAAGMPSGGAGAAGAAVTLPSSKYFDLDTPSTRLFWKKPLQDPHHIMQSFAFDQANGRMYFAQLKDGGSGDDLCITQTDLTGKVTGHMYHNNAGHGVSIGVESVGKDSYLWVETDSSKNDDSGRGTALLRFKFVNGKTPSGKKYFAGSSTITAATDPLNDRIVIRRSESGKMTYRLYSLAAAAKGDFSKTLAKFTQPSLSSKSVTFQGYTIFGQYLYTMDGTGHDNADDINSYVTRIDMKTGKVDDRALTKAGNSLIFREPEGLAVYKSGSETRLCMGFGSHDKVGGSNRLANVYFKNVLKP
jgi:hypothetical protein